MTNQQADIDLLRIKIHLKFDKLLDKHMLAQEDGYHAKAPFVGYFTKYLNSLNKPVSNKALGVLASAFDTFNYSDPDGYLTKMEEKEMRNPKQKGGRVLDIAQQEVAEMKAFELNTISYKKIDDAILGVLQDDGAVEMLRDFVGLEL